jgi:hypothetical protein
MREIKFRFYCNECKCWHETNLERLCDPKALDFRVCNEEGNNASGFKEYTGLKDKNGKEAYHEDACQDDFTGLIWQVAWHEEKGCWYLMPLDDKMEPWGSLSIEMIGDFKIIGNTLENPELLEG